MAALTTAVVSRTPLSQATGGGGAPVAVTSGGDTFSAGPDVYLRFTNTGGSASVVTIATPGKYKGIALAGEQVTVPATTGDLEVGPYPADPYTADGSIVSMTYTNPTNLKVAVKKYAA